MLLEYVSKALEHSSYKQLEDGSWFAEIAEFPGVWANAASVESCRSELVEVLEEWLLLRLRDHDPIPVLDGIELGVTEQGTA